MTNSVHSALQTRSRQQLLEALCDRIAAEIDAGVPARELASLSLRLSDLTRELEQATVEEQGDDLSEAAATPDEPFYL